MSSLLTDFQAQFKAEGYKREHAFRLVQSWEQWLASHIVGTDLQLKPCLNKE